MPFMNGIEFTQTATDRYPNLIIIIMTAIDQFEYARKCVSMPVFEYMLKPMVRAEIDNTLNRARERLLGEKDYWEEQKNQYHGRALVTELIPNQIFINRMFASAMRHLAFSSPSTARRMSPRSTYG